MHTCVLLLTTTVLGTHTVCCVRCSQLLSMPSGLAKWFGSTEEVIGRADFKLETLLTQACACVCCAAC
eukprot:5170027-Pleurochrysis_carterae.AAC.2